MRERCLQHGLAVGPDGMCVLCRSRRPVARKSHATFVVVALLAVVAGGVVWRTMRSTVKREALPAQTANTTDDTNRAATAWSSTLDPQSSSPTDRVEHHVLKERDPRGLAPELRARGELDVSGQYFAGQETFELFLPAAAVQGVPHGMLVWISSDPSGAIPIPEWRRVLAAHHLVWVGPNRAGNDREIALRIGLALDSIRASRQRVALDETRVYIGGLSGGAKSAFRALLFYPEVFRGALLASGVEYYREVAAVSRGKGVLWPARIGLPTNLALAKCRPVALTAGANDFNYGQISDVVLRMREDSFAHVQIFSWQELGHAPPPAELFDRALAWLIASNQ
jgi:predicted esterase